MNGLMIILIDGKKGTLFRRLGTYFFHGAGTVTHMWVTVRGFRMKIQLLFGCNWVGKKKGSCLSPSHSDLEHQRRPRQNA